MDVGLCLFLLFGGPDLKVVCKPSVRREEKAAWRYFKVKNGHKSEFPSISRGRMKSYKFHRDKLIKNLKNQNNPEIKELANSSRKCLQFVTEQKRILEIYGSEHKLLDNLSDHQYAVLAPVAELAQKVRSTYLCEKSNLCTCVGIRTGKYSNVQYLV